MFTVEKQFIPVSGKPILQNDGYWHIEWSNKNGEKKITAWGCITYELALKSISNILPRYSEC